MTEIVINGQKMGAAQKPPKHIVRIRNHRWKEGDDDRTKYFLFPLPEQCNAEVRVNALGYSVYFSEIQIRKNPIAVLTEVYEQRSLHTECFFEVLPDADGKLELTEILNTVKYTEWEDAPVTAEEHRLILDTKGAFLKGKFNPGKPS